MQTKKAWKVTENVDAINCELSGSIINLEFWDGNNLESVDENIKLWRISLPRVVNSDLLGWTSRRWLCNWLIRLWAD